MKKSLIDNHGEVRELTSEDMASFKPIAEAAPDVLAHLKRSIGQRGAQKAPTKVPVSLRLNDEVVEHFRSSGKGWQGRINDLLVEHIDSLSPPKRVRETGVVMRKTRSAGKPPTNGKKPNSPATP